MISYSLTYGRYSEIGVEKKNEFSIIPVADSIVKTFSIGGSVILSLLFPKVSTQELQSDIIFSFEANSNVKDVKKIISHEEKSDAKFVKMRYCMQIQDLSVLEKNWDGYGAIKVLPRCISNAQNIINYKKIICEHIQDIYANPNGTVSILWENEDNESIGLELGEKELSYYVTRKNSNEFVKKVPYTKDNYKKLAEYIAQL